MATLPLETIDGFIKAVSVLARSADHVLETRSVKGAVKESPFRVQSSDYATSQSQRGSQTSTQIARYLGVTKPAVSQIVDAMVNRKLIARKPAKHDRREIGLVLTESGKRMMTAVRKHQRQTVRVALRGTGANTIKQWIKTSELIAATVASADKAYEEFCAQCGAHENGTCIIPGGKSNCVFLDHEAKLLARRARATGKTATRRK